MRCGNSDEKRDAATGQKNPASGGVPPRNSIWALITRILCPRVGGASRFDGRIEGFCADWLPCSNRTYKFALARHRNRTRHRSYVVAVRGG